MTLKQKSFTRKILIYIALIIMAVAALFPILFCLSASLRTQDDLFRNMFPFSIKSLIPTAATLENYVIIFTKHEFWRPIMNTMIVTVFTIIFGCILNSMAAFAFTCFEFKGKKILYPLVLISFMVPFEAIAIPLYSVASNLSMVDTYAGMIIPAVADGLVTFLFIQFFKDIAPSLVCYGRTHDLHEPMEFLYVAVARRTLQGHPHNPDCDQPVQRRTFYTVDLYLCKLHGIRNHPNLPVPAVPETFRGGNHSRQRERIDYEENISNRKPQPGYGRECRSYAGDRRDNLKQ